MAFLGIELGSTRIKAIVIDGSGVVWASGSFVWGNKPLSDTVWSYNLDDARKGLASACSACADGSLSIVDFLETAHANYLQSK